MASRVADLRSRLAARRRACAWWAFQFLGWFGPSCGILVAVRHSASSTRGDDAPVVFFGRAPPFPAAPSPPPIKASAMAAPSGPPVFSNQELVNELESLLPTHWDEQQLERKWDACVANPDGGLERFAFTAMELKYLARERAEVHARTRRGSRRWRQT